MERFWSKVRKTDGCWWWTGGRTENGHGRFWREGRLDGAPRVSLELLIQHRIPRRLYILHRCGNPLCVRPEHLYVGRQSDNMRDAAIAGTLGCQKLLPEDVLAIRKMLARGVHPDRVANEFGITTRNVYMILRGRTWGWLTTRESRISPAQPKSQSVAALGILQAPPRQV